MPEPGLQPLAGERAPQETPRAVAACNDWLRLGPGRTLPGLLASYAESGQKHPPAAQIGVVKRWSARFGWASRAARYDALQDATTQAQAQAVATAEAAARAAHRQAILEAGFASDLARIQALDRLARLLSREIYRRNPETHKRDRLWVPDVKSIGGGEFAERVDIERFNGTLISEFRGTLEDLAKETGGRVQRTALTDPTGTKPYHPGLTLDDLGDLSDAELAAVVADAERTAAARTGDSGPGGAG